ncbi:MAG: glycosyltransferase family 2 protein, partial [Calditrichaeota bacterium]
PENILLYRHEKNLGKGMALQTGFRELLKSHSPDMIITIDSDLQHPPEYIPEFIHSFEKHGAHVVTGYRKRDLRIMPLSRIISNSLTSLIISLMTGQLIPDSQCGFRLIDATILPKMHFKEKRFHLESEFLIKSGWSGLTINSVKIPTIYHSEKSSINHLRDTLNFVWLVLRLLKERSGF